MLNAYSPNYLFMQCILNSKTARSCSITIAFLSMLDKILLNVKHSIISNSHNLPNKLLLFGIKLNKMIRAFVLCCKNTYLFSRCFTYSTIQVWNSHQNEAGLTVK